jgi:hypothetical protein
MERSLKIGIKTRKFLEAEFTETNSARQSCIGDKRRLRRDIKGATQRTTFLKAELRFYS